MRGHMTKKVDVFAFGVVVLEIIAGRPNYDDKLVEMINTTIVDRSPAVTWDDVGMLLSPL